MGGRGGGKQSLLAYLSYWGMDDMWEGEAGGYYKIIVLEGFVARGI